MGSVSPAVRSQMRRQRTRDTAAEMRLRSELHRRGIRFRLHRRLLHDVRREVDIVIPQARLAVFVDGCFWHSCPIHGSTPRNNRAFWAQKLAANAERDADTVARLRAAGWTVIRIWEHEDPVDAAAAICAAIGSGP